MDSATFRTIATEEGLSGVLRVDVMGATVFEEAFGLAHRGLSIGNTTHHQFGLASGTKGFTALAVMSMVERGELTLDTPVRQYLGADLALIDDRVTVAHLLAHRSGIGDYLDEDVFDDPREYVMPIPVHQLATAEQYLRVLDGYPMKFAPDERFNYNNGGYVVLALVAERASGIDYHELVDQRVCHPAGMGDTVFLRSDELPGRAAIGYLDDEGLRSNVLHLPVRGVGDGGIYSTTADLHRLWDALFAGRIVSPATVRTMITARSEVPEMGLRCGLGFFIHAAADTVSLRGFDAGIGFVSACDPNGRFRYTVVSNKCRGAWPVSERVGALLNGALQSD